MDGLNHKEDNSVANARFIAECGAFVRHCYNIDLIVVPSDAVMLIARLIVNLGLV